MELIFNPCGEFRWSREGIVSQIHSPPASTLVPWDLLRSFKVYSDAKERVRCGKQREATAPVQSLVKLQPWFLSLWWKTCLRQNCSLGSWACSEGPALGRTSDDDDFSTVISFRSFHPAHVMVRQSWSADILAILTSSIKWALSHLILRPDPVSDTSWGYFIYQD